MRLLVLAAALLFPSIASAAPFCVVDNYGNEDCGYYSMASCRDSARFRNGACVYKPEAGATAQENPYDFGGAIMRGMEAGRESRRKRELHDLEMSQREAEIEEIRARTEAIQQRAQRDWERGHGGKICRVAPSGIDW